MKPIRLIPALIALLLFPLGAGQAWAGSAHVEWLNGNGRGGPPGPDVLEAVSITGFAEDITTSTGGAVQSGQAPAFAKGEGYARVTARSSAVIVTPTGTASASNGWLISQGQTRLIPIAAGARLSLLEDANAAGGGTVSCSNCGTAANQTAVQGTNGSAAPAKGVLVQGSDGTNARNLSTDTSGRPIVVGANTNGGSVGSTVFLMGGSDGSLARTVKTDTLGQLVLGAPASSLPVTSSVNSGSADTGGPVKTGGRYNTTAPTLTDGQRGDTQLDTRGNTKVTLFGVDSVTPLGITASADATSNATAALAARALGASFNGTSWDRNRSMQGAAGDGLGVPANGNYLLKAATYSAAGNVNPAASATDVCVLTGSASKTVWVTKVKVSGVQTTSGNISLFLHVHSTADSGGTGSATTPAKHAQAQTAATAVFTRYTANPTVGNVQGVVRADQVWIPAATAAGTNGVEYSFGDRGAPIVLSGTAQEVAVNLSGNTITGGNLFCSFEWIEF